MRPLTQFPTGATRALFGSGQCELENALIIVEPINQITAHKPGELTRYGKPETERPDRAASFMGTLVWLKDSFAVLVRDSVPVVTYENQGSLTF